MDYQVSARKYRPGTFDDVIGQPQVVQALTNAVATKRLAHAFLFSGTRGVGKTTVARILAKALSCGQAVAGQPCGTCVSCTEIAQGTSVDVVEIDGASNTSVDDVREIRENAKFSPFRGAYRVYIIDEVHMLSNSAFNALLKILEEPPAHVVFIFATTEIHKIPATILSRCQHYTFRRIARAEIVGRLEMVAGQDAIQVEPRSLLLLARASEGSMRDALSLFDQAVALCGTTISHADLEALVGAVPQEHVHALIHAMRQGDGRAAVETIARVLDQGLDLRAYCAEVVEYLRNLLVATVVTKPDELHGLVEASAEDLAQLFEDTRAETPEYLSELFKLFAQAEDSLRQSLHPRFVLETAAIRASRLRRGDEASAVAAAAVDTTAAPARPAGRPVGAVSPTMQNPSVTSPTSTPTSPSGTRPTPTRPPTTSPSRTAPPPRRAGDTSGAASPGASRMSAPPPSSRPTSTGPASTSGSARPMTGSAGATASRPAERSSAATPRTAAPQAPSGTPARQSDRGLTATDTPSSVTARSSQTAASVSGPLTLNWEEVVAQVADEHPSIAPFLEMGLCAGIEGDEVTVGFPAKASVARARMEAEDNLRAIREVCERVAGRSVRVRITELSDEQKAGPTMAQVRAAKQQEEKMLLFERTRAHPLVKHTLEAFGGDVVDVRRLSSEQEA
ncbi:MAG: DNA polymerase III subunit gamma/tau [Nitrospiraceae bacterium]